MPIRKFVPAVFAAASLGMLIAPAAATAASSCKLGTIAELPATMEGTQPLVSAKINGVDVRFLADTGAFYSMLTPGNAAELHLFTRMLGVPIYVMGVGGMADVSVTTVKTLTLAGVDIPRIDFLVGGSEIGGANVGALGENVLGLADGEYDLANGMIKLMKPTGCSGYSLAYWDKANVYSVVNMEISNQSYPFSALTPSPAAIAYLNGKRIRVVFDTGASTSVLSLDAAARAGVRPGSPGVHADGYGTGVGRRVADTWIAPFDSFKIGDEEIKHTKLRMEKLGLDNTDMLLGADFFLSHHIYVANSQHKIYFTYNGGPVFRLPDSPPTPAKPTITAATPASASTSTTATDDLKDAESYSRRGQARLARHDFADALSDLDHAVALAPAEPRYLQERSLLRAEIKQPQLAMQDIDAALKVKPDFIPALITRAELRLVNKDTAGALADIGAVDRIASKEANLRLELAEILMGARAFDRAVPQYDFWISAHPDDARRAMALNGRCWARAQLGQELQRALTDCNGALRLTRDANTYDSRGLVQLRLGAYDKAIADYDAALALQPKTAWSLYGRGVAEIKTGHAAEGQADIAAATAINAELPVLAKSIGVTP